MLGVFDTGVTTWYQGVGMLLPRTRWVLGLDHCMHCVFSCMCLVCYMMCVTCCVDYIHGRMYIGKYMNTRVREHNLRGSENE